jgi:hypothetical protein
MNTILTNGGNPLKPLLDQANGALAPQNRFTAMPASDLLKGAVLGCAPNKGAATNGDSDAASREPHDEELNAAISSFQAELQDWTLANLSLSTLASRLQEWANSLWTEFLPKEWKGGVVAKPSLLFLFEWEPPRRLGHYRPGRNAAGCRWEISVNPANLSRLSEIQIASVALHELLHCFEDIVKSAPRSHNGYHSAWLRTMANQLGIPCTRFGCTCGVRPDSAFMGWATRHELKGTPVLSINPEDAEAPTPKRKAWVCNCPNRFVVIVHVASGSTLKARCEVCGALFHPRIGKSAPRQKLPHPNLPLRLPNTPYHQMSQT